MCLHFNLFFAWSKQRNTTSCFIRQNTVISIIRTSSAFQGFACVECLVHLRMSLATVGYNMSHALWRDSNSERKPHKFSVTTFREILSGSSVRRVHSLPPLLFVGRNWEAHSIDNIGIQDASKFWDDHSLDHPQNPLSLSCCRYLPPRTHFVAVRRD